MRVARYHGNKMLCAQIDKARLFEAICTVYSRLGPKRRPKKRNISYIRVLPIELVRYLAAFLFPEFHDELTVHQEDEGIRDNDEADHVIFDE